jgi:sorbitol-specific phosphotransferase system component IIA
MSPSSAQGQKAYQNLLELGFVSTPYAGGTVVPGS